MVKNLEQNSTNENILYNNILLLSRNRLFYTKFDLCDTFQNRIHLIFLHISFLLIKIKYNRHKQSYKDFYQKTFDLIFNQIEQNMREVGFGDTLINKNMKFLIKTFYTILLYCEKYKEKNSQSKNLFFRKYLELNSIKKHSINGFLIEYFNKYEAFCFDLSSDSVLRGDLNFNYK